MADNSILSRLDGLKLKYEETGQKLTDPEVIADVKQFVALTKEYKELEPIIETSERYRTAFVTVEKLTLFLDRVEATGENALFLGDGAPGFEAAIRERLGDKAHFAQPQHNGLRAGSACALAARRLEAGETPLDYITLLPLYLRAPQAERERAAREGAKHG